MHLETKDWFDMDCLTITDAGEILELEDVMIDMSTLWMILNSNESLCMDNKDDRLALLRAAVEASPTGR